MIIPIHSRTIVMAVCLWNGIALAVDDPGRVDPVFTDVVAAWQMGDVNDSAGKNTLTPVGKVTVGNLLEGIDRQESLASGNDGRVAQFDGGYLDAGQGSAGALNLSGAALTISVRLRNPSGAWGQPLFSKHGGHDQLLYNLFSSSKEIGFELGTREGLKRVNAPLASIGADGWHTIICRYDGRNLQMFADGVLMDETVIDGGLRDGNSAPCLIGAEAIKGIKSGWKGQIDHVAIWKRPLSDGEVVRLSGGATRIASLTNRYTQTQPLAPLLPPRADLYQEPCRPQFHFTARQWTVDKPNPGHREEGWLNDINGLVHYAGEYHFFAQRWNRCWIHAVSTDLVHWTELQPAFWDDHRFGSGVQSGGAVIDHHNTSGLSPDPKTPPMVAFWSGNDNISTCISYSLDKGRTWSKYAKNPVLRHVERDPKVVWHEAGKQWVMVLYGKNTYFLFTSPNLLDWTKLKYSIPHSYECPDLFQLPINGDLRRQKWVLVRGDGRYSLGDFDGTGFHEETKQVPCDEGPNFYATMSWGDIEGQPGRRIQVSWMRCEMGKGIYPYPGMPFSQQVSFPCDLTLREHEGSLRLFRKPVPEIAKLHGKTHRWKDLALMPGTPHPLEASGHLYRILAEVEIPAEAKLTFTIRGASVVLTNRSLTSLSKRVATAVSVKTVEILVDRTSIEAFANDGEVSLTGCFVPTGDELSVICTKGGATIRSLEVIELESMWKGAAK